MVLAPTSIHGIGPVSSEGGMAPSDPGVRRGLGSGSPTPTSSFRGHRLAAPPRTRPTTPRSGHGGRGAPAVRGLAPPGVPVKGRVPAPRERTGAMERSL
jgi:hypothetical protein